MRFADLGRARTGALFFYASTALLISACGGGGSGGSFMPLPAVSNSEIEVPPVIAPVAPAPVASAEPLPPLAEDKPYVNLRNYPMGGTGNVDTHDENAAVTHHRIVIDGKPRTYTATVGHLITRDQTSNAPQAAHFYTAYTLDGEKNTKRPVTFFFNGGPGSASTFLHMGSFAPRRVFTLEGAAVSGPNDVKFGANPETLLGQTDLVFMDPIGTGYSVAIAPKKNKDFWGVDADNNSLSAFIHSYLTVNNRGQSPVMLFGESYGGPRAAMMSYVLHANYGIKLSGLILLAPALNFYEAYSGEPERRSPLPPFGFPTAALTSKYHGLIEDPEILAKSTENYFKETMDFAFGPVVDLEKKKNSKEIDDAAYDAEAEKIIPSLKKYVGAAGYGQYLTSEYYYLLSRIFSSSLVASHSIPGKTLGSYDTRKVSDGSLSNSLVDHLVYDPSLNDLTAYDLIFASYRHHDLKYQAVSKYKGLGKEINQGWNRTTTYPDNETKKFPDATIHLAAEMQINDNMKVMTTAGYYDAVVPAAQVIWDMMSVFDVISKEKMEKNYSHKNYEGGHMMYADDKARVELHKDFSNFYTDAVKSSTSAMN